MIAYQTDANGVYVGPVACDESPLEPGTFLIPGGAVTVEPPTLAEGEFAQWDDGGWRVGITPVPEPEPEPPLTWEVVRAERDSLLAECDWTQLADAPVDSATWAVYRQALRDIPQDYPTPEAVVWPVAP